MRVLITGANRGIGQGLAQAYRAEGAEVLGTARDGSLDITLDVSDPSSFEALSTALGEDPLDLLICNAGVYLDKGETLDGGFPAEQWAQSFAVNVMGVFLGIQTVLPNLRAAKGAKIAILSSTMASDTLAPGGSYIYRASKAAVLNLGRNLSADLKAEGIAVGMYHPGWVKTDMGGNAADITTQDAVTGLHARFAELDLAQTGCFRTWDGRDHPY